MKKFKLVILLIALAIFGSAIYYFEIYKENINSAKKIQDNLVVKIPKEKITKISFTNSYDNFEILQSDTTWVLTKPVRDYADRFVVERLLEFFSRQSILQDISGETNPDSAFGFSDKNMWMQISGSEQDYVKVTVSDVIGLKGNTYLRVDNGDSKKYYLAAPEWRGEFDRTLLFFRDKFIFRDDMNDIVSIEKWQSGKKVYEVKDTGSETWQWKSSTVTTAIDKNKVYDVIKDLVQASATDFLEVNELSAEKKKQIGFDKTLPAFNFSLKGDKKVSFKYSKPNSQKIYIELNDRVYELFSNAFDFLDWELDDYKNRSKPFDVKLEDATEIVYLSPAKEVTFIKQDSNWSNGFPGNRFIRILTQQKVVRYLPDTLPPQVNSSLTILLSNKESIKLSWSNDEQDTQEILMTSSRINETFLVGAKEWNELISNLEGDKAWDSKDSVSK